MRIARLLHVVAASHALSISLPPCFRVTFDFRMDQEFMQMIPSLLDAFPRPAGRVLTRSFAFLVIVDGTIGFSVIFRTKFL